MAKNLAESCLCPSVLRKVEHVDNEVEYLADEITKQSVERTAWGSLIAYRNCEKK